MADKRLINLALAGRKIPVWVNKQDEKDEELLRLATRLINKQMEQYQKKFSDRNDFDILAMTCLQAVKELVESKRLVNNKINLEELLEINDKLDEILKE
jgi:hypothetical protein